MRLKVPVLDGRSVSHNGSIVDLDTGNLVGEINGRQGFSGHDPTTGKLERTPSWSISLLDKYSGQFETWEECAAFADGVQSVLNHMVALPRPERVKV
jgi:hypothetical protein